VGSSGAFFPLGLPGATPPGVRGAAERLVADRIRSGRIALDPELQRVDDVIGVKIVGTESELAKLEGAIDDLDYTWAFDREVHDGSYVGTHYTVDLELDPAEEIIARGTPMDWSFAVGRGLPETDLADRFREFVLTGSRTFRLELILTTFEDLVESEFGTCIHEQRILDQREIASDFSRVARNASSLIEFMLSLAISRTITVDSLPVKLWGLYVRDMVAQSIARLNGSDPAEWVVPPEHFDQLTPI
jgi:hypothetical protein